MRDGGQGVGIRALGWPNLDRHRTRPVAPYTPPGRFDKGRSPRSLATAALASKSGEISRLAEPRGRLATPAAFLPVVSLKLGMQRRVHGHSDAGAVCARTTRIAREQSTGG